MAETLKIVLFHPFFKTLTIFYGIHAFVTIREMLKVEQRCNRGHIVKQPVVMR